MNGADTTPARWCAVCMTSYVREPQHYHCPSCDDGLKVTPLAAAPVKAGTPVSSVCSLWTAP